MRGAVLGAFVPVEHGRLYYERAGEGFPVVLLHPGLWDRRIWDPQFEAFAEDHDTIRYDLRGAGRSEPPERPYSDLADLRALLAELGIERCALVGCSSGAQLAIDAALAHPELVDAIVAASPALSGHAWADEGLVRLVAEVDRAVRAGDAEAALELELAVWTPPRAGGEGDDLIRAVARENLRAFGRDGRLAEVPPSAAERLGEVTAATLVIVGDDDLGEIHRIAQELADGIPGASKHVIAGADHLVNVRRPEKFNRLVLDFLAFRA